MTNAMIKPKKGKESAKGRDDAASSEGKFADRLRHDCQREYDADTAHKKNQS